VLLRVWIYNKGLHQWLLIKDVIDIMMHDRAVETLEASVNPSFERSLHGLNLTRKMICDFSFDKRSLARSTYPSQAELRPNIVCHYI
jgi:hypothetical protein